MVFHTNSSRDAINERPIPANNTTNTPPTCVNSRGLAPPFFCLPASRHVVTDFCFHHLFFKIWSYIKTKPYIITIAFTFFTTTGNSDNPYIFEHYFDLSLTSNHINAILDVLKRNLHVLSWCNTQARRSDF